MSTSIDWYNDDHTILIYHIEGKWTLQDYIAIFDQLIAMTDSVTGIVDIIGDFQKAHSPSGNVLSGASKVNRGQHPRTGWVVLVGINTYLDTLLKIVQRVYSHGFKNILTASSIEEAHQLILSKQQERNSKL